MAIKPRDFTTIFDEINKQMTKEGHQVLHAGFNDEKVDFGIKNWGSSHPSDDVMDSLNRTPVAGRSQPQSPNDSPSDVGISKNPARKQVKLPASSTIQSAAYWPGKQYLLVSFKSGHTYSYADVPIQTIGFWEFATSAGSWFFYNIRMSYKYQKLS
jgi:hypothetical protein